MQEIAKEFGVKRHSQGSLPEIGAGCVLVAGPGQGLGTRGGLCLYPSSPQLLHSSGILGFLLFVLFFHFFEP